MPHKSVIAAVLLVSFLTGVFARSFYDWSVIILLLSGICLLIAGIWKPRLFLLGLAFIFCLLGNLYFELRLPKNGSDTIQYYNGNQAEFTGIVAGEVEIRNDHQKIIIETKQLIRPRGNTKISGRVLVKTNLYPQYSYGDQLNISCEIMEPEPIEDFEYDKYLALSKIYSVCYRPLIEKISEGNGNIIYRKIYRFKNSLLSVVNRMMGEPQASFLAGLLVGARRGIPDTLMEAFHKTGVTHIIAISGYNITIIASIVLGLTKRHIGRKKAFWLVLIALGFFAILTGAQASVVRATIMGIIVLIARQVGRLSQVGNIIVATACLIMLFNPLALAYDAGFQLSFLATIGLVYFFPIIEPYFSWMTEKVGLRESLISTLSATALTLPLIVYQFGRLSIVAPIVNLLILPVIPLIMAIGFAAAIIGLITIAFGQVVGWIAWLVMQYVITVVKLFSQLPFSSFTVNGMPIIFLVVSYALIAFVIKKKCK